MLTMTKIYLSSPHMGGSEQKYVNDAFETNWIAPLGPHVDGFEEAIERYLNENIYAAVLSSGTASIHMALQLLGVGKGDDVLCQSFTFSASANPIVYQGAHPVFIDSETDTWNMSPELLEKAIIDRISKGKKPKAIIMVHLYGMPAKIDEILEIAHKYQIPVVEDAAEARLDGQRQSLHFCRESACNDFHRSTLRRIRRMSTSKFWFLESTQRIWI